MKLYSAIMNTLEGWLNPFEFKKKHFPKQF